MAGSVGEKRVALVIGNAIYEHADTLKNPINDAKAISAALTRLGFSGAEPRLNLNNNGLRRELREFKTEAGRANMAVIYFAGHGIEVDGRNFLIPTDARLEQSEDVKSQTASLDQALNSVDGASWLQLIILDACRNNPFRERMMRSGSTRSIGRGLRSFEPGGNVLVAYAAEHGTFALDGKNCNSPFAEALCEHIEKPGLEISQLFREVRDDVMERTERKQKPHLYGSLGRKMIYLKAPEATDPITKPQTISEPPVFDKLALELQLWESIKDHDNPPMFVKFLERFPDGVFAPLAKKRLAELEWQRLRRSRDVQEILNFLKRWPDSRFEAMAQRRLSALRRKQNGGDLTVLWKKVAAAIIIAGMGVTAINYYYGKVPVSIRKADGSNEIKRIKPGSEDKFQDCWKADNKEACGPEMVVVPAGHFMMGSPENEKGRDNDESPQHKVKLANSFAVGKFEVTFAEWDQCVAEGGCKHKPSDRGWGRDDRPVINVSWDDITKEYLPWLRKVTGKEYRLLTEAEWEYAAHADTQTRYSFGDSENQLGDHGWYSANSGGQTHPIGAKKPNKWRLYDVHGNVWEWVQDCYADSYENAPHDGTAAKENSGCFRVLRGHSWDNLPQALRSADRYRERSDYRYNSIGFRVARTLNPDS